MIEISYRGKDQDLPKDCQSFKNEEELKNAIDVIVNEEGIALPKDFSYGDVWKDVSTGIGWDFHPSNYNKIITLSGGFVMQVYRHEINSALSSESK